MRYAWQQDRSTYIREQLLETVDGIEAPKDISAATIKIHLRAFADPSGANVLLLQMTKVQISGGDYPDSGAVYSGAAGWVRFQEPYERLVFRLVLVDEAVIDASSISGYREQVYAEWVDHVAASPQT